MLPFSSSEYLIAFCRGKRQFTGVSFTAIVENDSIRLPMNPIFRESGGMSDCKNPDDVGMDDVCDVIWEAPQIDPTVALGTNPGQISCPKIQATEDLISVLRRAPSPDSTDSYLAMSSSNSAAACSRSCTFIPGRADQVQRTPRRWAESGRFRFSRRRPEHQFRPPKQFPTPVRSPDRVQRAPSRSVQA